MGDKCWLLEDQLRNDELKCVAEMLRSLRVYERRLVEQQFAKVRLSHIEILQSRLQRFRLILRFRWLSKAEEFMLDQLYDKYYKHKDLFDHFPPPPPAPQLCL